MAQSPYSMNCEGWWEQDEWGRQPMTPLRLKFVGNEITGIGMDCIGAFTFVGSFSSAGAVYLRKQYLVPVEHGVDYHGHHDGEGTMSGEWDIDGLRGPWLIRIAPDTAVGGEIQEIGPPTND